MIFFINHQCEKKKIYFFRNIFSCEIKITKFNMSLITNTNLVVDHFNLPKKYPQNKYIFFLTHMHAGQ